MTLLTVDDLRKWPQFATTDADVLELLLEAEEGAIEAELGGPVGAVTEVVDGGLRFLTLRRRASAITSVTTVVDGVSTTLATDDHRLRYDRRTLERLVTGTNPSAGFEGVVTVVYDAEDDSATRKRVQKDLVDLDLNSAPGTSMEQIGAWLEQTQKSSVWNESAERRAILATLWPGDEIDFA